MYTFLSIVYVLVCLFLIFVVLLQPGRGGGMGSSFGGGSSQTVFGASGAGNFLTRLTTVSATLFMVLSVVLAYMSSSSDKSLEKASLAAKAKQEAKAKQDAKSKDGKADKKDDKGSSGVQIESTGPNGQPIKLEEVKPSDMLPPAAPAAPEPVAPVEAKPAAAPKPVKLTPVKPAAPVEAKPVAPAEPPPAPAAPAVPAEAPATP